MTTATALLSLRNIQKSFGGVHALRGVDLDIMPGQVTALVGENGAGKSTLMKLLAGGERPDAGTITFNGVDISPRTVGEANEIGISIVFQELSLFPHLTVGANIFSLREPARAGVVDTRTIMRSSRTLLDRVGSTLDPRELVGSLSIAEQQLVEIAKALATDAKLLILDEPNSALRPAETQRLLEVIAELRAEGVAIVLVSHRLEEVFTIADEIVVLRSGQVVNRKSTADTSMSGVVADMLGAEHLVAPKLKSERAAASNRSGGRLILERVSVGGKLVDASLEAGPGEIIGLAGLEGAGHSTVLDVLFGRASGTGRVVLPNGKAPARSERQAVKRGIAYVPSDRKTEGLMLEQSIAVNLAHVSTGALGENGAMVSRRTLWDRALRLRDELQIRMSDPSASANTLSGGNQQKLVFGKWWSLPTPVALALLDDPTRGVDVGGKADIYRLIRDLGDGGSVVLITSSDLLELAELCDRVYIFHAQHVTGFIDRSELSHGSLLHAINTDPRTPEHLNT